MRHSGFDFGLFDLLLTCSDNKPSNCSDNNTLNMNNTFDVVTANVVYCHVVGRNVHIHIMDKRVI